MIKKIDKSLKLLLFILIVLLFAVVLLLFSVNTVSKNGQSGKAGPENGALNVDENSNDKNIQTDEYVNKSITYPYNEADEESTVFSGLISYGKENNVEVKYNNNFSSGGFIESIGEIKNGDDDKYWQYYINGIFGDMAADKKILKRGDNVEWRFEEAPF